MASIFTYDPDPPRVASPWLTPTDSPKPSTPQPKEALPSSNASPVTSHLADYGVTRLEAEPQEGPTEYKLHLLLRPRRNYSSSSTGSLVTGSQQHKQRIPSQPVTNEPGPILAPSNQSRQNRLEQLTTQLLWRLQQSSPYHASSISNLVLPKLPEATENLSTPPRPGKLLAGLEESRGALYEIGVSDDGTFVGLTKDEMDESLTNLRAMAASLGCNVEVVRMVVVGDCEWQELSVPKTDFEKRATKRGQRASRPLQESIGEPENLRHQAQLWVAEALVTPDLRSRKNFQQVDINPVSLDETPPPTQLGNLSLEHSPASHDTTEQLRITLTGPTTSGKSSLLGTLSTATLDNGRGKSRLSLLKHRHEIESGVTSSVAQELIGYRGTEVVNYAAGNVTSWTDIHASAQKGRLVFVSDTGGHPRYRRTTVRGLVGWAPHWTVLCIAADDSDNAPNSAGGTSSAQEILGAAGAGIDLAKAHLELCLKFDKPLAIVITKLDLASRVSLRQTLSKILTAVKATGRTPIIVPPDQTKVVLETDLSSIAENDANAVQNIAERMALSGDLVSLVPIVMTSAAKGTGIRSMHALLQNLPMPKLPTAQDFVGLALNPEQPASLFHIEDVFGGLQASYEPLASNKTKPGDAGSVVAGYLRFGRFTVGDTVVLGPFPSDVEEYDSPSRAPTRSSPASLGNSMSHSSTVDLSRLSSRNAISASASKVEWFNARIVSLRNLRLPVHTLDAAQVGTIGLVFDIPEPELSNGPFERPPPPIPRIRKGLVMAIPNRHMIETGHTLQAASGFSASFEDGDINSVTVGSLVVVYIASIRASARVLKLVPHTNNDLVDSADIEDLEDDVFGLHDNLEKDEQDTAEPLVFGSYGTTDVTFELITNREWIELGSQVLLMPGGGHGLYYGSERGEKGIAGLEGFVGKVVEVID
ncbi:GTP-binding protein-like protein 2 [Mollisia scopiformis]|uniref:GTP-binding protein-like protein 2 n=1 Tax=Mollisia scopiformis TaxID=149040 RepID=A0A194XUT7_MOLSC|nr:GTP-binding protein-like protein 2 [Mollisia scopiformis]KUJ24085.1 GTP-binding protein-like protein 2 [Mollisia scopiformis]